MRDPAGSTARDAADRYRVTAPVGRGGMGEVCNGPDLRPGRPAAIKLGAVPDAGQDVRRRPRPCPA